MLDAYTLKALLLEAANDTIGCLCLSAVMPDSWWCQGAEGVVWSQIALSVPERGELVLISDVATLDGVARMLLEESEPSATSRATVLNECNNMLAGALSRMLAHDDRLPVISLPYHSDRGLPRVNAPLYTQQALRLGEHGRMALMLGLWEEASCLVDPYVH